jgi:Protein of unknown function (DUF3793)
MKIRKEYSCQNDKDELLRYLLVKVSPIMMKVKPAVLVRISNCFRAKSFQHYNIFCSHQKAILDTLAIDYMIMKNNGSDIQVLFYDKEILSENLASADTKAFLNEQAYADNFSTTEYLFELRSRFCRTDFPHEIGIFLGYPLKDVKGFILDYKSGISVVQGRWRVFGDPAESVRVMSIFRFAENFAKRIIEHYQEVSFCVKKVKSSVITENGEQIF